MKLHFSEGWTALLSCARDEAMRTGWLNISPDHLMLAILRQHDNDACRVLSGAGIDLSDCKAAIDRGVFSREPVAYAMRESVFPNARAVTVLNLALAEAMLVHAAEPSSLHLLAALLRTEGSCAHDYLTARHLTLEICRAAYPQKTGTENALPDPVQIAETLSAEIRKMFAVSLPSGVIS